MVLPPDRARDDLRRRLLICGLLVQGAVTAAGGRLYRKRLAAVNRRARLNISTEEVASLFDTVKKITNNLRSK